MKSRLKLQFAYLVLYAATLTSTFVQATVPKVDSVTPQCGSVNGGTRITVYGTHFARNFFNFGEGNEDLGSKVRLSLLESIDCDIHPDGSTETQIQCYTRPMAVGTYTVKASVDGVDVPNDRYCDTDTDCEFEVSLDCTPTIQTITPASGLPGQFIELTGNIITTKYGSNEPDEFENIILRVYFGGQKCEVRDEANDEMYGISLSGSDGYLKCKTEGTYIGNHEISFLVSNDYGRSSPSGKVEHVRSNGIAMYQTYTDIASLSQSEGSTEGGTRIVLSGQHFDETDAPVRVLVGEAECVVVDAITDTEITCDTPADASIGVSHFSGNRGFYAYVVNGSTDGASVDRNTAEVQHIDESRWAATGWGAHAVQIVGFFLPPHSGNYRFCVKAASTATVYLSTDHDPSNKVEILSGSGSSCSGAETDDTSLQSGNKYYVEIHYGSSDSNSYVSLVAHYMDTELTEADTGMAEQEIQDLAFISTVTTEIQSIRVASSGVASQTTQDVQEVHIRGNPDAYFALGLDGVFTIPIRLSEVTDGNDVSIEMKKLPSVLFDINVEFQDRGTEIVFIITSDSSQGEIHEFEGRVVGSPASDHTFSVVRQVLGTPDLETFTLSMAGVPSPPIAVGASANDVKSALETMFSVKCHPLLSSGSHVEDYENSNAAVSEEEPFCGRYMLKNPRTIYTKGDAEGAVGRFVSSSTNRLLCLAFKGLGMLDYVRLRYIYTDLDGEEQSGSSTFTVENTTALEKWSYACEDIFTLITGDITGSGVVVESVQVYRKNGGEDLFIDQVMFVVAPLLDSDLWDGIQLLRMPQAQPNGYFIDSVSVTESGSTVKTYEIEMTPHNCGYNFPLFELAYASSASGSTYILSNDESVAVSVSRSQAASPPIQGSYYLTFKGETSPDPVTVTVELDSDVLVSSFLTMNVGFTEVTASGTCSAFTYRVKMLDQTGNQPLMDITGYVFTDPSVAVSVNPVQDGGVYLDPIMGDHCRTYHTSPQVIAFINNVPTRCAGDDVCQYTWNSAFTPEVTDINPISGSMGQEVQITGSGFSDASTVSNEVVIGETSCTVTAVTTGLITCTIGNGPTGSAQVFVTVTGKGLASGSVTFTYVTGVTSFSADPGSVEGGTTLTVAGFGFTPDVTVTVGGEDCTILSNGESEITCKTPRAASHTTTQVVDVEVVQPGSTITAGQFTYNPAASYTPVISSISEYAGNVWGGPVVTIVGTGFGNVEMPVTVGGESVEIDSYSDTQIVGSLPALSHGSYRLLVDVENLGYADLRTNAISDITYTFMVSSMSPSYGSLYGGTDLLITGVGFHSNSSLMDIAIGDHTCIIDEGTYSSTQFTCRIDDTGMNHDISATGTHRNYGVGYAWDKDPHQINVGDTVTWHWETPTYVSDIAYSVHQTDAPNNQTSMDGGFSSGEKTRIGSFSHRFTVPGTYYYWTGFMDSAMTIFFRGTITVVNRPSHSETLMVTTYGEEAFYDTSASTQTANPVCSPLTSSISGCSDSTTFTDVTGKFNFQFRKCSSPYIESISNTSGTFTDVISFTGNGFGSQLCQNEVFYDGAACEVVSSDSSSIDFMIDSVDSPPVGVLHEFTTRIGNLGYALVAIQGDITRRFGLLPHVQGIQPFKGSKMGGTTVTITGAGFSGGASDITVNFDYLTCDVESATYTTIVCQTHCDGSYTSCVVGAMTGTVAVSVGGNNILADCVDPSCRYITSEDETALVESVTPSTVSAGSTDLVIEGMKFGAKVAELMVEIGGEPCIVSGAVSDTRFTCTVGRLPVGDNEVHVYVSNNGLAAALVTVASSATASVSVPADSSVNGGATLVISGNGFVNGSTSVSVEGEDCPVIDVTLEQVRCTLPAMSAGTFNIAITSNDIEYANLSLTYSDAATPQVDSISPAGGQSGDLVTISGSKFTSPTGSDPTVTIGGVDCPVASATSVAITCNVGTQETGDFFVEVFVEQKGFSNNDVSFTYELGAFSISPNTGSTIGGQVVTLTGSGFLVNNTIVTICGETCEEVSVSASTYVCKTAGHAQGSCDVVATVNGVTETSAGAYQYDSSLVSTVTGVDPVRGGTGGGTLITITGTNFGSVVGDIAVEIAGAACTVQTVENTEITCRTGSAQSSDAQVEVQRNGWGLADQVNAGYEYIDLWSSPYTWGGLSPPEEGSFVVIGPGQKILLDNSTEVLSMLLIQGGALIFDEATLELQAENILITDGGLLQAGTEDRPFPQPYKATITMHGHLRSKELPIYGTKTLGVREGTLNLFGTPTSATWTRLASTANAGDTVLELEQTVDWQAGDEIVIATTGHRHSQAESELRTIASVSGNQVTITEALTYKHLGISGTFGSHTVDFRAEVGHFTRNVMVQGYRNTEFDVTIEACEAGFDTGEFATQTCFQGRFGEELGSDQFGAQIMIHQTEKDTQVAQAHLSFVEIKHAGQAFRMGRYPIHFHLNGNMNESFVRGCSIHTSFNRAVNVHGSHNTMIEHNIIYNVMGGSFFLEDGDETGNTFQYNLAVFVRSSTSLRNDDITPAAFWATNPNNNIIHNAVAGGTHFGTWYRMHTHPDGPGFDASICPQAVPLGEYRNNSAHSLGWFGLWIFETYVPRVGGSCSSSADHQVAQFFSLTAWNCEKGAEGVNSGALQFREFVLVNNEKAGYEGKLIVNSPPQYSESSGPGVFDSVIVAHYDSNLDGSSTGGGIIMPYHPGFLVYNTEFYNFDQAGKAAFKWARIDGTCNLYCGGFTTETEGLSFTNSPNKVRFDWESEGVLYDRDGTLTGNQDYSVAPYTPSFPGQCAGDNDMSVNLPGVICSDQVKLIRFSFNNPLPTSMEGKSALFTSEHGTSVSPFAKKRITHKFGWSMVLASNSYYNFSFENAGHITNISFDSVMYRFDVNDYIVFTQFADLQPDLFMLDGVTPVNMSANPLSGSGVTHGDWYYDMNDRSITYAIKRLSRRKRSVFTSEMDLKIDARIIRCYYRGCSPPPLPMELTDEPSHIEYWSDPATWDNFTSSGLPPEEYEDLIIPQDKYIVVDVPIPKLGKVVIEGGLQIDDTNSSLDILLEADYIYITGRLIAGWSEDRPLLGNLLIRLRGSHSSPVYPGSNGPTPGAKFIGVFGGLQLHGKDKGLTKTYLAQTVDSGNTITVTDAVSWDVGDDILITTTDYNAWHSEVFRIQDISGNVITLNDTIQHRHIAHTETVGGQEITLSSMVAVLSRNIRIEGEEYPDMESESFGGRVLVSQTFDAAGQHSGFAQVYNVEFYHMGQEGFKENYDARFALTYMDVTSTIGEIRYSYAKKNAFHSGFNTAIGVFAVVGDFEVDGNTVYHTVSQGIRIESENIRVTNNLVALSIWPGAYQDRNEPFNFEYDGAIGGENALNLVLINNTVAGSERFGYRLKGQACSTDDSDLWYGNVAHGALIGVGIFVFDEVADSTCTLYSGFTLWKNLDMGFYYNNEPSVAFKNNVVVENGLNIFATVAGPSSLQHLYADKYVEVTQNIIVGKTSTFSETLDVIDTSDDNIKLSSNSRGSGSLLPCGKIGVVTGTFLDSGPPAPEKPFTGIMSYNTIKGRTVLSQNTFVNFGACTGGRDHAVATNKDNDDGIHPLHISSTTFVNVESTSKVFFHRPNVGKINSADCVDMDCDGLKKCMIRDLDGTFLGHVGTVLPDSAYEWDGNPQHGLGDYRIPTAMLTTSSGGLIDVNSFAPNKGIYKVDNCTWVDEWQAYDCENFYQYRVAVIESMDSDTETRRLSPVAIHSPEGYVDLINGPQDHGWCSGYTCRKRVSTFLAIVALDQPFDIFLSSTNPKHMRYMLLNSNSDECVRLGMWYTTTNRLEVEVDGSVVLPTNGYFDQNGGFRLRLETTTNEWMPDVNDKINGQHYLSRAENMIFWTQCGDSEVHVKQTDVFVVSFTLPAMSEAEFFGEKIVENLAAFLNIDPAKVRIVDIVEDTSSSGRRKRNTGTTEFVVEIADTPGETPTVDYAAVGQKIVNQVQVYSMDPVLNATVLYTSIQEPGSPSAANGELVTIKKVGYLVMDTHPVGDVRENQLLSVQPKFKVVDEDDEVVTYLGSYTDDWVIEVSIKSGGSPRSQLVGNTTITFQDGWANFTNLAISSKGENFILEFNITSPPEAANYSLESLSFRILGRSLEPKSEFKTNNRLSNYPIEMEVSLFDLDSNTDVSDIEWANHTWTVTVSILDSSFYSGTLGGSTTVTIDPSTGKGTFLDLELDRPGKCPMLVTITSDPGDYYLQKVVHMDVQTLEQSNIQVEVTHDLGLSFDIVYDETRKDYWTAQVRNAYSEKNNLRVIADSGRRGSLVVTLTIEATAVGYNETLETMCSQIENSTTFTFDNTTVTMSSYLTVDGVAYYGVSCGEIIEEDDDDNNSDSSLETVYIVVIVILSVIVVALIVVLLAYKFYFHPNAKTYDTNNYNKTRYLGQNLRSDLLEDTLGREDTFTSLKSRPYSPPMAPVGTAMPNKTAFDLHIQTPGRDLLNPSPRLITPVPSEETRTAAEL